MHVRSDPLFLFTLKQICIRKEDGVEYEALGIASQIKTTDGRKLHLTLIDFFSESIAEDDEEEDRWVTLDDVRTTVLGLGLRKGYIFNSGNSFHYIGEDMLPWGGYQTLLERMKKREAIGEHWPFYQLKKGFGVLRIFACPEAGKPIDPYLVERFEDTQLSFPFY